MFILNGNRRINTSSIKQYKPTESLSNSKNYYKIELVYLNGDKEELHFHENKEERDLYLVKLDKTNLN